MKNFRLQLLKLSFLACCSGTASVWIPPHLRDKSSVFGRVSGQQPVRSTVILDSEFAYLF